MPVRHGPFALDIADDLQVIVAVTFGDGQADFHAARGPDDSGILVVRQADCRCLRGAGGADRESPLHPWRNVFPSVAFRLPERKNLVSQTWLETG